MNDLERLDIISRNAKRRLQKLLKDLLDLKMVTLKTLKTAAYCANELMLRIPENSEFKQLMMETIYALVLEASLDDVLAVLRPAAARDDRELFEHLFPNYDSDSQNYDF